jgi:hypothetical protein
LWAFARLRLTPREYALVEHPVGSATSPVTLRGAGYMLTARVGGDGAAE